MEEKKVRVILAITKSNWGGAGRYVYDIAKHFATDKNIDLSVITGGTGSLVKKLEDLGVRVITIPHLKRDVGIMSDLKSSYWLYKILKKEKPDVFNVNSSKMGLFGSILGRLSGVKKIIFTAHGWPFNEVRPLYQRIIFRLLGMLTVLVAHKTIAVSHAIITSLRAPRFITKKMTCVYTGIEAPKLYPRGAFFETFNLEKTPGVHIVSVGELHVSKGYDRALVALTESKHLPWTYHIMGTGDKKEYLEKLISQLGLEGRVILHGFVENASLYLNSFDLFLFPSRTEALGYVAIEAIFSELPIVASKAGGIPEVLFDDPYTRLIDCNNGKVFRETLAQVLQKLPKVEAVKRPGRTRFLQSFMFTATRKIFFW